MNNAKINVLYIVHELGLGGSTLSLIDYLRVCPEEICPVVVVPAEGKSKDALEEIGIKTYVVQYKKSTGKIGKYDNTYVADVFRDNYEAARIISEIVKEEKINIIHSNTSVLDVGIMAATMADIPHVWHIREFAEEDFGIEYIDKSLKKILFNVNNLFITISDRVAERFSEKYCIESTRIYDGISMNVYNDGCIVDSNKASFLFAGSVSRNKGQFDAIKAVALLVADGVTDIKLYIIGSINGQSKWLIQKFIEKHNLSENIELIPFTRELDLYRERCGYAIIGSKMEALGRVTVEAMAAGNIPIGTDSGGTKELIGEDGKRGFLYKYGDYHQLAAKMQEAIMLDDDSRKRIIGDMREFAVETFDVTEYGKKILNIYKSVLENDTCKNKRAEVKEYLENRYNSPGQKSISEEEKTINYKLVRDKVKENIEVLGQFLSNYGFRRIVIYGMGDLGCTFYDYLSVNNYEVIGVMDENADLLKEVVNVIEIGNPPDKVDCILVTPLKDQIEVVGELNQLYSNKCRVVGIEEAFGRDVYPHVFL